MTTKHTLGPWYLRTNVHRNTDGTKWGWLDTNQAGNQCPPSGVHVTWSEGMTSEANARLIAAAPELLEALQEIVGFWDALPYGEKADVHKKARAAIAKAKGGAV